MSTNVPIRPLPLMQQINIMTDVMQLMRLNVRETVWHNGKMMSPTLPSSFMTF